MVLKIQRGDEMKRMKINGREDWGEILQAFLASVQEKLEGVLLSFRSISPFPGRSVFSIAEIELAGEKIHRVLDDTRDETWTLRWIIPSRFGSRVLPGLESEDGQEFVYPLRLIKAVKASPLPSCVSPIDNKDIGEITSFTMNSVPDLNSEENRILPSWWAKAMEKWRYFVASAQKKDVLAIEDLVRLESSLNGIFLSFRGMQECGAEERSAQWNGLKDLEEARRVDVDWWGRQQGRLRRPHVSHEGRLCPFQTPESPRIGLQLHLASGAKLRGDRVQAGDTVFSPAVGLIPYPLHTDGPRLLMGGKNMKQAETGIRSPEPPLVPGYLEGDAMDEVDAFPAANRESNRFFPYLGRNVWAAVMPFDGYTYEDGLVVSESLAEALSMNNYIFSEKKLFRSVKISRDYRRIGQARFEKMLQDTARAHYEHSSICLSYGDMLPLAFLEPFFEESDRPILFGRYFFHVPSRLAGMRVSATTSRSGTVDLEIRFSYSADLPLSYGDKLTGRHGNKGVVTRILPDCERPVATIAGREMPIDLVISPCSILGRKNLGQILEMLHGALIWGRDQGIPGLDGIPGERLLSSSEVRDLALPALRRRLDADGEGFFPVRLPDGKNVRAFVGPQYFLRLHHHCLRKLQARGGTGPVDPLTCQPGRGGARTAQKMGEMEHWSLLSYPAGSENLLLSLREWRLPADSTAKMREVFSLALLALGFRIEGEKKLTLRRLRAADKRLIEMAGYSVKELSVVEAEQYLRSLLSEEEAEKRHSKEIIRINSIMVKQKTVKGDSPSPGEAPGEVKENCTLPFDEEGAFWIPLGLFAARMDMAGVSGAESPDVGFFRLCDRLKTWSRQREKMEGEAGKDAEKAVKSYTNLLLSFLGGKDGLVRGSMMGRRFLASGRSVIVPEPSLAPDEVFLPSVQMAEMLAGAPDILKRLGGTEKTGKEGAVTGIRDLLASAGSSEALDRLLRKEPVWCLAVRQPSLHRHSVQAFRVRVWDKSVIGLPPLVTPGFNADFDGDTMAVFLPPEPFAGDLSQLSILENPGIVGTGEPAFAAGLDLALGWSALQDSEKKAFFERAGAKTGYEPGITLKKALPFILRSLGEEKADFRREILQDLQKSICRASTGMGSLSPVSFQNVCDGFHSTFPGTEWTEKAISGDRKFLKQLETVLRRNSPGSISLLVNSGAKGGIDDLRAMGAFLGRQDQFFNDETNDEGTKKRAFISANLWEGLNENEMFVYSYSCRDSMASKKLAVAEAGYFSRLLAEGLFETSVTKEDCGAERGVELGYEPVTGLIAVKIPGMKRPVPFPSKGDLVEDLLRLAWGRVPVGMERCLEEKDIIAVVREWKGESPFLEGELKAHLGSRNGVLEIRSPLCCLENSPGLCSRCCGADLAGKPYGRTVMVPVGTRVGLTAAQAIGERGTQLAMKRFHQVSGSSPEEKPKTDRLRDILVGGKEGDTSAERFRALMEVLSSGGGKAEKDLPQAFVHFEIALRPEKGLGTEASTRGPEAFLSALAFERAGEVLRKVHSPEYRGFEESFSCLKSRLLWH